MVTRQLACARWVTVIDHTRPEAVFPSRQRVTVRNDHMFTPMLGVPNLPSAVLHALSSSRHSSEQRWSFVKRDDRQEHMQVESLSVWL